MSSYNGGVIAVADGVSGYRSSVFDMVCYLLTVNERLELYICRGLPKFRKHAKSYVFRKKYSNLVATGSRLRK